MGVGMDNKETAFKLTELIVASVNENSNWCYTEEGVRRIYRDILQELKILDKREDDVNE